MAKKITPTDDQNNGDPTDQPVDTDETQTGTNQDAFKDVISNSFVDSILQTFPAYDALYIDSRGGTYTSDTPEALRGDASLYKNPYHKTLNLS